MDRYQLQLMLDSVRVNLKKANEEYQNMLMNTTNTMEERKAKKDEVLDLKNREEELTAQIKEIDDKAAAKLNAKKVTGESEDEIKINAKAQLIRNTMKKEAVSAEVYNALGDGSSLGNGDKILPKTMTNELLYEPLATNPLRKISTFTNITNLEIPKISFSISDDAFVTDGATAKELAATGDVVTFARNKFKVFCDITETVLNGTNTNLVAVVNSALESGLAKKEKSVAFDSTSSNTTMSFYHKTSTSYDIKAVEGDDLFSAIISALADLEDDYSENATIVMKKSDYFNIIKTLANGNATLYTAQPEQVLGAPVVFCDLATIPVVGDFRYSHFNYDLDMLYDTDKNVKTGINSFVLTAWIDHKIKLKSAFRLATIKAATPSS